MSNIAYDPLAVEYVEEKQSRRWIKKEEVRKKESRKVKIKNIFKTSYFSLYFLSFMALSCLLLPDTLRQGNYEQILN
jgi:hypothetical protein